jgi:hypothetical protein
MLEKTKEEVTGRKNESPLEEGERHNLIGIGCRDVLPFGRPPLKYHAIREEMVLDKFEDFTLVYDGFLEHVWVRSDHGEEEENQQWGIGVSTGGEERGGREMCTRKKKVVVEIRKI